LFIDFDSLADLEPAPELCGIAINLEETCTGLFGIGALGDCARRNGLEAFGVFGSGRALIGSVES
jgi:hypothetical protein